MAAGPSVDPVDVEVVRPRVALRDNGDVATPTATGHATATGRLAGTGAGERGNRALFAIHGMRPLLVSAVAWNFTLWGSLFIGTETLSDTGASVLAVQLTGMASWAPLLLGGAIAGRYAARVDRIPALRRIGFLLGLLMAGIAISFMAGGPRALVYVATFAAGLGMLANLTLQRPALYELAGPTLGPAALALDALGMATASCLGPLLLGFVLSLGGPQAGYVALGGVYLVTLVLLRRVPLHGVRRPPVVPVEVTAGARFVPSRGIVGLLGITVIVNFFYFPFLALIPVLAARYTDASWSVGVLAAAPGLGMIIGISAVAIRRPVRLARPYLLGSAVALAALVPVAQAPSYPTLFAALVLAGLGLSGFTAAQGSLVMAAAPATMRSQAMGLLATAVGVLPLGTLVLGLVAEHLGPVAAVTGSGLLGVTFLALWTPMWLAVLRLPPTIPLSPRTVGRDDGV